MHGVARARHNAWRVSRGELPAGIAHADADLWLAAPETVLWKQRRRKTVGLVRAGSGEWVFKRFRDTAPRHCLEVLALGSSAASVWNAARLLGEQGFRTPEYAAVLERKRLGLALESCAIARRVVGPALSTAWLESPPARRAELAHAFALYLRALHAAGIYVQDLRPANLIVPLGEPLAFVLIDMDRVRRWPRLSWARRVKNLVQVHRSLRAHASQADELRFLRTYLGEELGGRALADAARDVLAMTVEKDALHVKIAARKAALHPSKR